jgi:hypothetical protein
MDRLALLEGFVDLVSERWGYFTARRLTMKDASEKTEKERKASTQASKAFAESIKSLRKTPNPANAQLVDKKEETLKTARTAVKDARKPFNDKVKPLADAIKYCDSVAIPDSLKELGKPVVPQFNLSDWAKKAVEQTKKKKA